MFLLFGCGIQKLDGDGMMYTPSYAQISQDLMPEIKALFPYVETLSCSHTLLVNADTQQTDTVMLVYLKIKDKKMPAEDQQKLTDWMMARTEMKQIKLLIENQ